MGTKRPIYIVEYHHLEINQFCSGATFVPKANALHEDDGWIISFVHDEGTNISQASIKTPTEEGKPLRFFFLKEGEAPKL